MNAHTPSQQKSKKEECYKLDLCTLLLQWVRLNFWGNFAPIINAEIVSNATLGSSKVTIMKFFSIHMQIKSWKKAFEKKRFLAWNNLCYTPRSQFSEVPFRRDPQKRKEKITRRGIVRITFFFKTASTPTTFPLNLESLEGYRLADKQYVLHFSFVQWEMRQKTLMLLYLKEWRK